MKYILITMHDGRYDMNFEMKYIECDDLDSYMKEEELNKDLSIFKKSESHFYTSYIKQKRHNYSDKLEEIHFASYFFIEKSKFDEDDFYIWNSVFIRNKKYGILDLKENIIDNGEEFDIREYI